METTIQAQVRELQQMVEQHDRCSLKLNWDMLSERPSDDTYDYFAWDGAQFIGFLGVYDFGNKLEMCGMVHPNNRRQGIGKRLLNQALLGWANVPQRKLLNVPEGSKSGRAFVKALEWSLDFTEYEMSCSQIDDLSNEDKVFLRKASEGDIPFILEMDQQGFAMSYEEAKKLYTVHENVYEGTFIIEKSDRLIGKMRLEHLEHETWLYGFVIDQKQRGRGLGRAALQALVQQEVEQGRQICLEVVAENEQALRLYTSAGFTQFGAQHYYYKSENDNQKYKKPEA
ncbi:GNAT family N-acetyltransferase [Bacillaceae bacterium SIJ1]|uniref:GNAT family N-acetyltransferase n=1 Tax=Litoribacterium kuwaitense TaxID=1398745 RepID=UPI0013E9FA5B|nr:GNAT family N-acetyltransferase [Litoribacterium kuwaitense]NGP45254.1 GNAT family N-acetyltransferase [Litoribacterium kuwaitense]